MSEAVTVQAGGRDRTVQIDGPEKALAVLLLTGGPADAAGYAEVTSRLGNSGLRSLVLADVEGLGAADVIAILDQLGVHWAHLAGSGAGAALAWKVAAHNFDRISSLVVIDQGHPAAADAEGHVLDAGCPPVEVSTTLILTADDHRTRAYGTGRHTYSDYRVVELPAAKAGAVVDKALGAALATEIILRSNPW